MHDFGSKKDPEQLDSVPSEEFLTEEETLSGMDLGEFRAVSHLHSGTTGEFWLALKKNAHDGHFFVAKTLRATLASDKAYMDRFWARAREASSLFHPHVVQLITGGVTNNNVPYLIFEYVTGVSLANILEQKAVPPLWFSVKVACQICSGLHYAHGTEDLLTIRAPIVHLCLSPKKVLIASNNRVKVLGLGISQIACEVQDIPSNARLDRFVHIAPEQLRGAAMGPLSDIYGVGILLYHLLTGTVPYASNSVFHLIQRIAEGNPKPIAQINHEVPPELERIVMKAMHRQASHRYSSANALREDLLAVLPVLGPRSASLELVHYLRELFPALHWTVSSSDEPMAQSQQSTSFEPQEDWEIITVPPSFTLPEKMAPQEPTPLSQAEATAELSAEHFFKRGLEHYRQGALESARQLWEQALLLEPQNPEYRSRVDQLNDQLKKSS